MSTTARALLDTLADTPDALVHLDTLTLTDAGRALLAEIEREMASDTPATEARWGDLLDAVRADSAPLLQDAS